MRSRNVRTWMVFVFAVTSGASTVLAQNTVTGCLTRSGKVQRVAAGKAPRKDCKEKHTQFTLVGADNVLTDENTFNTALGDGALAGITTGQENTAVGGLALTNSTTGSANSAFGAFALINLIDGGSNTAVGNNALFSLAGESIDNIAIGDGAGGVLQEGNFNIYVGNGGAADNESGTVRIGTGGEQDRVFIAGIRGVTTGSADAITAMIDSQGQLGTVSSSARVKRDISDMGEASKGLMKLRPVTFRYRKEYANGSRPLQYGLIAEEVARVYPDLVVYSARGEPEGVQYHKVNAMLLNEMQRQHRRLQKQQERIGNLEHLVAALASRLNALEEKRIARANLRGEAR